MLKDNSITLHSLNKIDVRIWLLCTAFFCAGAMFIWQGWIGFNLWDEGFLWYGAQRVLVGEVPILDFMAYDPGRYYWAAAIMKLCDDNGIIVLRVAVALFQALGLFIGLNCLFRNARKTDFAFFVLAVLTLLVWMYPRHKLFDISLSLALLGALASLVQKPSGRRYFLAGTCVGFIAVFGRNHGLYGVVGSFGVMAYLAAWQEKWTLSFKKFLLWCTGVIIGYLPVVVMILLIPGFAQSFWGEILFFIIIKTTNLPLPVPWPWNVAFGQLSSFETIRGVLIGLFFIAVMLFVLLGVAWLFIQRFKRKQVEPTLVAAVCLSLPYAHYAYSRADIGHLAQGIFPFLIGMLALLATRPVTLKWGFAILLSGASLMVMLPRHPGWQYYSHKPFAETTVGRDTLKVDKVTANNLSLLQTLVEKYAPNGQSFIAAPYWPGAYAAMGIKAPVWEIYPLYPGRALEQPEIDRIKAANPGFALIFDMPLDGRDSLRYRYTHPAINKYINDNFEIITGYSDNPLYKIYRKKQASR